MFFKKKFKIIELENRIKELEEKICPCEQHDYIKIEQNYFIDKYNYPSYKIRYKCKKCGKELIKIE